MEHHTNFAYLAKGPDDGDCFFQYNEDDAEDLSNLRQYLLGEETTGGKSPSTSCWGSLTSTTTLRKLNPLGNAVMVLLMWGKDRARSSRSRVPYTKLEEENLSTANFRRR